MAREWPSSMTKIYVFCKFSKRPPAYAGIRKDSNDTPIMIHTSNTAASVSNAKQCSAEMARQTSALTTSINTGKHLLCKAAFLFTSKNNKQRHHIYICSIITGGDSVEITRMLQHLEKEKKEKEVEIQRIKYIGCLEQMTTGAVTAGEK